MFSRSLLASVLAATALAAPAPAVEQRATGDSFTVIALHSTSAVHLQPINANGSDPVDGNAFFVGRDTRSFCPELPAGSTCPAGTATAFTAGDAGRLTLDSEVPGGQLVYIDVFGNLKFTTAHTGGVTPEGAILDGWTYTPPTSEQYIGTLTHGTDQIKACGAANQGFYIVVQYSHDISIPEDCIDITLGPVPFQGFAAWQYE